MQPPCENRGLPQPREPRRPSTGAAPCSPAGQSWSAHRAGRLPPVGHSVRLWLGPGDPIWHVGAGWAALGGGLASGALSADLTLPFSQPLTGVLTLGLVWLLADPLLGTVWESSVGLRKYAGPPLHWLPYTQSGSPAWGLAERLGEWRTQWHAQRDQPEVQSCGAQAGALLLSVILAAVLGHAVLALVVLSVLLRWLVVRLSAGDDRNALSVSRPGLAVLQAIGGFGIPWLIGCLACGRLVWPAAALGVCLTVACAGMMQRPLRFRLLGAGQLAAACLLVGLRQPLGAAAVAIAFSAQWGLSSSAIGHNPEQLRRAVQPFMLGGLFAAAAAVAAFLPA
jgi:hypothetical protein